MHRHEVFQTKQTKLEESSFLLKKLDMSPIQQCNHKG